MPEIPDECVFDVEHDQIELRTATNGDIIKVKKINLNREQAASLAYLINNDNHLTIEVRIKT